MSLIKILMFITTDENMKDSNKKREKIQQTKDVCILRTAYLLYTLNYMQENWRKLLELIPDDEDGVEYNLLTFYKPKCKK